MGGGFLPLEVVDGRTLTYERFLRDFALPRIPCLIDNVGQEWKALDWTIQYFLSHDGVDKDFRAECAEGPPDAYREVTTTVGEALARIARGADETGTPFYLSAWPYIRGNSEALKQDFEVPTYFERAPPWLNEHPVLGNAAIDMKWLYIGSENTGAETHIDTNLTSAWLWVAKGKKEWVCAHGGDYDLLTEGTGSRAYGYKDSDSDSEESRPLPDFFHPEVFERFPHCRNARLYHGFQTPGMVCFNPSRCVHAVRNVEDSISLTHNFVDATNFADVIEDAKRSIRDEILPMARHFKRKSMVKMLAKTLRIKREEVTAMIDDLPLLCTKGRVREILDFASRGDPAISALLGAELEGSLAQVAPDFAEAAESLKQILCPPS